MRSRPASRPLVLFLLVGWLGACAEAHGRAAAAADGGAVADAAASSDARSAPVEPCSEGRSESTIAAPAARRAGYHVLLQRPRVAASAERIAALALVVSDTRGGMGVSDLVTFGHDGSETRAFFTSDVPYVIGTEPGLEEYVGGGGFSGDRVYAEIRRFDVTRFDVARSEDMPDAPAEPRLSATLDPSDTAPPHFEMANDGARAILVTERGGLVVYDTTRGSLEVVDRAHESDRLQTWLPSPRLSPRGSRVAFARSGAPTTLTVRELETRDERSHALPPGVVSIAFLGEDHVLLLSRSGDGTLGVLDLRDGSSRSLALGLPLAGDRFTESLDVSADGRTLVVTEEQGARLRVVRCEPSLVAIAGG